MLAAPVAGSPILDDATMVAVGCGNCDLRCDQLSACGLQIGYDRIGE